MAHRNWRPAAPMVSAGTRGSSPQLFRPVRSATLLSGGRQPVCTPCVRLLMPNLKSDALFKTHAVPTFAIRLIRDDYHWQCLQTAMSGQDPETRGEIAHSVATDTFICYQRIEIKIKVTKPQLSNTPSLKCKKMWSRMPQMANSNNKHKSL